MGTSEKHAYYYNFVTKLRFSERFYDKILFPVVFFALLVFAGCAGNPESDQARSLQNTISSGEITVDGTIDLGDIPIQGGTVDAEFTFRNDGDEPVVLLEATTSCMCTEAVIVSSDGITSGKIVMAGHGGLGAALIQQVMDSGEEAALIATFDPMAHGPNATGPITRYVIVKTNSSKTPEVRFTFQGNVIP